MSSSSASLRFQKAQKSSGLSQWTLTWVAIVMAFIIGEAVLQFAFKEQHGHWLWQDDAFQVNYVTKVDDARQYTLTPQFEDPEKGLSVGKQGFRNSPVLNVDTLKTQPVVVTLGDSVPFGAGVSDKQTYPYFLSEQLKEQQVQVINAGVPSYNLKQSLLRYEKDVLPLLEEPPAVVFIQAANDVSLLTYYREAWTPETTWANVRFSQWLGTLPQLHKVAMVYYTAQAVDIVTNVVLDIDLKEATKENKDPYQAYPGEPMLKAVNSELSEFFKAHQDDGTQFVLMPIDPFYYQTQRQYRNNRLSHWQEYHPIVKGWEKLINEYNQQLARFSYYYPNVLLLDTRQPLDRMERDELYKDFLHYTPKGNEVVAKQMKTLLDRQKLLPETE